ncbi:hypothetical protein GBAR_LOCUS28359, partial [Geodia barretti]
MDLIERRMRMAKAQMGMSKSTGYRAVEELLKAQSTQAALRRQFEEARLSEMTLVQREAFAAEEVKKKEAADAIVRKLNGRIRRADNESEQVHEALDQMLAAARAENERMRETMGEMGVSPRPTVAQWLRGKQEQRKRAMQDALINWDRSKPQRETAILIQQMLTSQRAMKHAAWGASKDISGRIRALKQEELLGVGSVGYRDGTTRKLFPLRPPTKRDGQSVQGPPPRRNRPPSIPVREKKPFTTKSVGSSESSVRATPHGFLKIRDTSGSDTRSPPHNHRRHQQQQSTAGDMWSVGHGYAQGSPPRSSTAAYVRATGPKTLHAPRTLHFLPPHQYRALKEQEKAQRVSLGRELAMG